MVRVQISVSVNTFATALNLLVLLFVIVVMLTRADPANLGGPGCSPPGFMPFGVGGVVAGAATGFFAYIGFDAISIGTYSLCTLALLSESPHLLMRYSDANAQLAKRSSIRLE